MQSSFEADPDILDLDDKATWDLICDGDTKGIFQLESPLGRSYAKKVRPRSIRELSDLIAIIRPGVLEYVFDEKNVTTHYIDRKFGKEDVTYVDNSLRDILKPSYGLLIYQEQIIQIAQKLAGMSLVQADTLRKAIGKKKVDLMAKSRTEFLEGCIKTGLVNETKAVEIFDNIEKSQRYLFNLSHSISYAINGYLTAYCKAHYPLEFFTSWLELAVEKQKPFEEIALLVNNAKMSNIEVLPPHLSISADSFKIVDGKIYYGLSNIKGIGQSMIRKLRLLMNSTNADNWTNFLLNIGVNIGSGVMKSLIYGGALRQFNLHRSQMWFELEVATKLTERELEVLEKTGTSSLSDRITKLTTSGILSRPRLAAVHDLLYILRNPGRSLQDSPDWIATVEEDYLGISLTCSKTDGLDGSIRANIDCITYLRSPSKKNVIAATVGNLKEYTINKGKNIGQKMGFLTVHDNTGQVECVLFSDAYEKYNGILNKGATVLVIGSPSPKDKSSLLVNKIIEI
jgi:DNA polymerase-3 subunit alpha